MVRLAGIEVRGVSLGGIQTCLDLPELKLCFDLGRIHDWCVPRECILFTHAHMDHMGGIAQHVALRHLQRLSAPRYVVPREIAGDVAALLEAWRRLDRSELECRVIPLAPGEELTLGSNWIARPFRSPHRVLTQGYALWSKKRKLSPSYAHLSQPEILRLKASGIEPTVWVETPEFVFTGDTLVEVVETQEVVRKARVLALEVTFLDERVSVAECRAKGHTHLDEVIERAELFRNEALLLTHFSSRYTEADVTRILAQRLPERLRERCVAFVPSLQSRG
jgi:ribonuclease Z